MKISLYRECNVKNNEAARGMDEGVYACTGTMACDEGGDLPKHLLEL